MRNKLNILTSLLGIVLGVVLTLTFSKVWQTRKFDGDYNRWRKLNLILQEVQKNYVDTIDVKGLTDAAVVAALGKLDPHSVYLPPVELTESETELAGNFEGIGITFNVPNDTAIVLSTIPGGPSEKAGLLQGDRIIKVDDKVIAGVKTPQDSMIRLMKGPKGTKVKITVSRGETTIPFDIIRDKIPVHCIDAAFMIDDATGYIKLTKFTRTTYKEFAEASQKLLQQGMKKLVFDLRNNSGGYFDQALLLSNEFFTGLVRTSMLTEEESFRTSSLQYLLMRAQLRQVKSLPVLFRTMIEVRLSVAVLSVKVLCRSLSTLLTVRVSDLQWPVSTLLQVVVFRNRMTRKMSMPMTYLKDMLMVK